jgi:hypothetical protein
MTDGTTQTELFDVSTARRQVRIVALLHAAETAGLTPISVLQFHTIAYLSNVLAPVWELPSEDGKIFKRNDGPFYPVLQHDVDRLIGAGVVSIINLGHVLDHDNHWRLEGSYSLIPALSQRILEVLHRFREEQQLLEFFQELAYALSALEESDLQVASDEDATYSDPLIDFGNVVDFGEWQHVNYSANAADYFQRILPSGTSTTSGEKLHMYVRHLRERMHARA